MAGEDEADQHTPLLHERRASFRNPFTSRRLSLSNPQPEDVDIDSLRLNMARVGSLSSASGFEPGGGTIYTPDRRPSSVKRRSIAVLSESDSKFIGISATRFWLIFTVVMLCTFIAIFDSTFMASSHPVITSYFGASQAASWLSTVFLIASTAFQPLFGRVSDTVGRRSMLLIAFAIFCLTTLWCAMAGSIESFIAARAASGIGAGGAMAMSMILVSDLVRIEDRGVFQSHMNFAYGLGSGCGAAFGGFLCDHLGWRWAFGVQVPVIALSLLWAFFFVPRNLGPMLIKQSGGGAWAALKKFDSLGSILLVITVTCLILALNLGGNIFPWSSPIIIISLVVSGVAAGLFIWVEKYAVQPLMPLHLLTHVPVANLIFANMLGSVSTNTILFNVPLFFQAVKLTSASESGFRLAVPSVLGCMAGMSSGYIITITRRLKPILVFGAIMYLGGAIAVTFLNRNMSDVVGMLLIIGVPLGQGFTFATTMMSALAVSPQADQAVVTTTLGLWRNIGVVLGVALSSLVFQNSLAANLEKMVTGPFKQSIIEAVRSSVQAVRRLENPAQAQGMSRNCV
ncbi:hypothetical protein DV738_g789, partial [Chaetothyriales sp. CBS 135597]